MNTRLERFIKAQRSRYGTALQEIRSGKKVSHWIWYIFPQLQGLGSSLTSQEYGIQDLEEACAYLENETLHQRYVEILTAVLLLH